MRLICPANSTNDYFNPASYAILDLTRPMAQRYLRYVWEYWRLKSQPDCEWLSEITFFEDPIEYYVSAEHVTSGSGQGDHYVALDDHPAMAALNARREALDQTETGYLLQDQGAWLRLPDSVVFENETDNEAPLLWAEGGRVEIYRHDVYFRARPKHSDTELSPSNSLSITLLQQIVLGEIGQADPCVVCLWDDQVVGDLCSHCIKDTGEDQP